jgi:sodium-independent sulfate anion transporter 11
VQRPLLRALVLDFSAVNFIDVTSTQALVDLRNQFDRYAAPNKVQWHFAGVTNPWTKRALVASGFGVDTEETLNAKPGPFVSLSETEALEGRRVAPPMPRKVGGDEEHGTLVQETEAATMVAVYGVNRPFFHVDIPTAVESAVQSLQVANGGATSALSVSVSI